MGKALPAANHATEQDDDDRATDGSVTRTRVNLESVVLEEGKPFVFVLDSLPVEIVRTDRVTGEESRSWAAKIKHPRTHERSRLWCPTMLASMLNEEGDGAIGGTFEATRKPREKGKRYAHVDLYRLS